MIIIHHPKNAFKNSDVIVEHIAKCVEGKNRYFEKFGEIKIETNSCEHFTNRCVLGLDFSELVDIKNKRPERVFDDLNVGINKNSDKLNNLTTPEQQKKVNNEVNKINKCKNQSESKFEARVETRINGCKTNVSS